MYVWVCKRQPFLCNELGPFQAILGNFQALLGNLLGSFSGDFRQFLGKCWEKSSQDRSEKLGFAPRVLQNLWGSV